MAVWEIVRNFVPKMEILGHTSTQLVLFLVLYLFATEIVILWLVHVIELVLTGLLLRRVATAATARSAWPSNDAWDRAPRTG